MMTMPVVWSIVIDSDVDNYSSGAMAIKITIIVPKYNSTYFPLTVTTIHL